MYTRILVTLDGSKIAETVLPYARSLARALRLPVEIVEVVDVVEVSRRIAPEKAQFTNTALENAVQSAEQYLKTIAGTFPDVSVTCTVEKGVPADVIIDKAAADKGVLISMATHGYSGIKRWLLGSIAEKVLRGTTNPLLLIRATEEAKAEGEATFQSVLVPLDGSELAETVLPTVAELAMQLKLEVRLIGAYKVPYVAYAPVEGYDPIDNELITFMHDEAVAYLKEKAEEIKKLGVEKVSWVAKEGHAADEIISLARETSDNLIAMCAHGRSGVKRWVLGSVTETVVRHSGDPVLVVRAA